jgi:DNA-binding MurR/RpiR family transcriptional regulator
MPEPAGSSASRSSPLSELCSALPSLPTRLREVGRFVAANDYDATTRSMRDLAAEAGADPAAFTRLAKALGYSGWEELRAALTEARRPSRSSPFSGRAKGRRHGPHADVALITDKLDAEAAGLSRISAASPSCLTMSYVYSGPTRCSWSAARGRRISTSARSTPARRSW